MKTRTSDDRRTHAVPADASSNARGSRLAAGPPLSCGHWFAGLLAASALLGPAAKASAADKQPAEAATPNRESTAPRPLDHSGKKRVGKASFYAGFFAGRKMADGTPMDPHDDNAASKTLPLGTTARVTNLETGKSAVVTIQDRGPYVPGRIVDLSPSTAKQIGITPKIGVAPVEVAPIAVPLPDGSVKAGDGAREGADEATRTAER
jgi:rare lipoprotein A